MPRREEPRYEIDPHLCQMKSQNSKNNNTINSINNNYHNRTRSNDHTQPCSSNRLSRRQPDLNANNEHHQQHQHHNHQPVHGVQRDDDDRNDYVDDYGIANIQPPRGFELASNSHITTNNHLISGNKQSSSSTSSTLNRPSSSDSSQLSNTAFNMEANNLEASSSEARVRQQYNGDINLDRQQTTTNTNTSDNTGSTNGIQETITVINNQERVMRPSTSINDGAVDQQNQNNSKPSTSSPGMFTGFNSLVSRFTKAFAQTSMTVLQNTEWCLQQDDVPKFAFGHKKSLEETWKLMDKVVKLCQRPRMNLNNSPPFILEILPETYQLLKLIHTKYDSSDKYPADDNDYSLIFLENLQDRCRQTLKLFKVAKDEMFNEDSEHRHKLTRNTLVFNHILSELKAIFPNGHFIGDKYLITKKTGAGDFWRQNFGSCVLVVWKIFYHALQQVHNIDSSFFSLNALKQTIDLTCDDYISIFEFDVFTRLFQPWSTLLKNWQVLAVTHPGYKAFLTYDELKARLQKHMDNPGSYVFRLSCTRLGQWAIGYVTEKGEILQTIVQNISLSETLTDSKIYLYPDGKEKDQNLSKLCSGLAGDDRNVTVTEEQYEIYCGVGNSVLTCKICFENDKNIRIEPCNHLLCTMCLAHLQESGNHLCPYCRTEIKETVQIKMDLPKNNNDNPSS